MGMFTAMKVSASGLLAQKVRLNTVASNLANANSAKAPQGGPYRRRDVVFEPFAIEKDLVGVNVVEIIEDQSPPKRLYEPGHPDADDDGYLSLPNINVISEMVNLLTATRAYEANLTAMNVVKSMAKKALDMSRF